MNHEKGGSSSGPPDSNRECVQLAEIAGGIGTFQWDLASTSWEWTAPTARLFGFEPNRDGSSLAEWHRAVFPDDAIKLRAAAEQAAQSGKFYAEFRVRPPEGSVRWLAGKGDVQDGRLYGVFYDITERKQLEVRLLALNETLEARITELREEARTLEILNRTGAGVAAELSIERLVQTVTEACVELTGAAFGAFFYNVIDAAGESYMLYSIAGTSREAFANFPMPRNTAVFDPTFRGLSPVRSDDILTDPRYGKNSPYYGMPKGHLPVRSYLAIPVVSRSGEVIGGLFFGHPEPGVFTDRAERIVAGIAGQAATAMDNARLYEASQRENDARRKAELELVRLNETLEQRIEERAREIVRLDEVERSFKILVEGVSDYAIFTLDREGHVLTWNTGAERIKGYPASEIIGQHFSRFYTEEDRENGVPTRALGVAARTGKFETEGWRVRKNGARFWASVVIDAIRDDSGEVVRFAKITRDMTERREAEEQLRQAQKMEAIGQLTGGVAHDFNNLLTIIGGNIETIQRHLPADNPKMHSMLGTALRAVDRASTLTGRLLAFSRRQPLDPKPIEMNRLIIGMSDLLARTLGERISVQTVLSGGLWPIFADANQLENAALNLAVNARDAIPGSGKLTIETANTHLDEAYAAAHGEVKSGEYVMLAVSDTGLGMTREVMNRAFEPFFTTKKFGEGTGLGLSQVYGFVKQSGGHIKIYSEVGQGTTVRLYFPRARSDASEDGVSPAAATPFAKAMETILVVEDEPDVRAYTTDILRELGYVVLEAADADEALGLVTTEPQIRLLFTDVGLPGAMNGRQLADEARRRRPDINLLFTTGYARNAIVHHGRLDRGVELIVKPFTFAGLASKIRSILDK
jgi:PAS domain S-box-containing protein